VRSKHDMEMRARGLHAPVLRARAATALRIIIRVMEASWRRAQRSTHRALSARALRVRNAHEPQIFCGFLKIFARVYCDVEKMTNGICSVCRANGRRGDFAHQNRVRGAL